MMRHSIDPVYNNDSRVLILGSFPSAASREVGFFYGHPRNRFWKVLSRLLDKKEPSSIEEKKVLLTDNHIALWDVIGSCEITGSSDASIKDVTPNDIRPILEKAKIDAIFLNGTKAFALYNKYLLPKTGISGTLLPSTSPANAAYSLDRLVNEWHVITNCLSE